MSKKEQAFESFIYSLHTEEFESWKHLCSIVNDTVIRTIEASSPEDLGIALKLRLRRSMD